MFNQNEPKDVPYTIFMLSMSFSALVLTTVILPGVIGVINV
jgi:hypothetical protein